MSGHGHGFGGGFPHGMGGHPMSAFFGGARIEFNVNGQTMSFTPPPGMMPGMPFFGGGGGGGGGGGNELIAALAAQLFAAGQMNPPINPTAQSVLANLPRVTITEADAAANVCEYLSSHDDLMMILSFPLPLLTYLTTRYKHPPPPPPQHALFAFANSHLGRLTS